MITAGLPDPVSELRQQLNVRVIIHTHGGLPFLNVVPTLLGSARRASFKRRERGVVDQTNIGTVSKATVKKLLREREREREERERERETGSRTHASIPS